MKEMVHELDFHREAMKIPWRIGIGIGGTYIVTTPDPEKPSEALMFYLGFSGNNTTIIITCIISKSPKLPQVENLREVRRGLKAAGVNVVVPTEVEGTQLRAWGIIPNTNDIPMT